MAISYRACSVVRRAVAENQDGTIQGAYATGAVSGGSGSIYVGGLMGDNGGEITQAYATVTVRGSNELVV